MEIVQVYSDHGRSGLNIAGREGLNRLMADVEANRIDFTSLLSTMSTDGALTDHVMSASKLHADDTPVPVLAPVNGKTKTGKLWTYVREDRPSEDATAPAVWLPTRPTARASARSCT